MVINTYTKNGNKFTSITTAKGTLEYQCDGKGIGVTVDNNDNILLNNDTYIFNNDSNEYEKQVTQKPKSDKQKGNKMNKLKICAYVFSTTVILIILSVIFSVVGKSCTVVDKVTNPDVMIYNYEWFKKQYTDYEAINSKIASAEKSFERYKEIAGDTKGFEVQTELARLNSIITGLENQRDDIVSEYNAKSKMLTRNFLKDKSLPTEL